MKKIISILKMLTIVTILVLISFFSIKIYKTTSSTDLDKINLILQMIYISSTLFLVFITYKTLKTAQLGKHQALMPYLILGKVEIWESRKESKGNTLDLTIYNDGKGYAKNIKIIIYSKKLKKEIYKYSYARLSVIEKEFTHILGDIRDELNKIQLKESKNGISHLMVQNDCISLEVPISKDIENYLELKIKIEYFDLFDKKYLGIFDIIIDPKNDEGYDVVEKLIEKN